MASRYTQTPQSGSSSRTSGRGSPERPWLLALAVLTALSFVVLTIRHALPDDRPFVLAAAQRLASFGPPAWRRAEEIVNREEQTLREFFEAPPKGSALLIAESTEGGRVGFAYFETLRDYFTLAEHGHVGMVVVAEKAEGGGVASALMRSAEGWAREQGFSKLTLTTFEGNHGARAVYEHLGYAVETLRYVKML